MAAAAALPPVQPQPPLFSMAALNAMAGDPHHAVATWLCSVRDGMTVPNVCEALSWLVTRACMDGIRVLRDAPILRAGTLQQPTVAAVVALAQALAVAVTAHGPSAVADVVSGLLAAMPVLRLPRVRAAWDAPLPERADGFTLAHVLVASGAADALEALFHVGVNPLVENTGGLTCLQLAQQLAQEAGADSGGPCTRTLAVCVRAMEPYTGLQTAQQLLDAMCGVVVHDPASQLVVAAAMAHFAAAAVFGCLPGFGAPLPPQLPPHADLPVVAVDDAVLANAAEALSLKVLCHASEDHIADWGRLAVTAVLQGLPRTARVLCAALATRLPNGRNALADAVRCECTALGLPTPAWLAVHGMATPAQVLARMELLADVFPAALCPANLQGQVGAITLAHVLVCAGAHAALRLFLHLGGCVGRDDNDDASGGGGQGSSDSEDTPASIAWWAAVVGRAAGPAAWLATLQVLQADAHTPALAAAVQRAARVVVDMHTVAALAAAVRQLDAVQTHRLLDKWLCHGARERAPQLLLTNNDSPAAAADADAGAADASGPPAATASTPLRVRSRSPSRVRSRSPGAREPSSSSPRSRSRSRSRSPAPRRASYSHSTRGRSPRRERSRGRSDAETGSVGQEEEPGFVRDRSYERHCERERDRDRDRDRHRHYAPQTLHQRRDGTDGVYGYNGTRFLGHFVQPSAGLPPRRSYSDYEDEQQQHQRGGNQYPHWRRDNNNWRKGGRGGGGGRKFRGGNNGAKRGGNNNRQGV